MSGEEESTASTGELDKQEEEEKEKEEGDSRKMEQPEFVLGSSIELQQQLKDGKKPADIPQDQGEGIQPTTDRGHKGLRKLFECELTAAKEKFTQGQVGGGEGKGGDDGKLKPSFGHRAGFDAFMTGYSFASIAVSLCKASSSSNGGEREREGMLHELREMKNKLANRGKLFPLHILKSHFANTSQQHKTAQDNIRKYFKNRSASDHER